MIGTFALAGFCAASILRTVGDDVHEDGFRAGVVGDAVQHFVGVQDDVVEVILRPGLDHLLQVVHVHGLGGQADQAGGVGGLGGVVGGDDDLRVVGRGLVAAR